MCEAHRLIAFTLWRKVVPKTLWGESPPKGESPLNIRPSILGESPLQSNPLQAKTSQSGRISSLGRVSSLSARGERASHIQETPSESTVWEKLLPREILLSHCSWGESPPVYCTGEELRLKLPQSSGCACRRALCTSHSAVARLSLLSCSKNRPRTVSVDAR